MTKRINIAIDGPVGCGKSTTAKALAGKLNYNFLDTGAMYRAVGYYLYEKRIVPTDVTMNDLEKIDLKFNEENNICINGEDVEAKIRTAQVGQLASDYSTLSCVREFLAQKQKEIVREKGFIAEGRDIGSVIIPDAEIKIYLTASVEERARRRLIEFVKKGETYNLEEVKRIVEKRDFQDMNRKISPLIKCVDAIEVDTSEMSIEEQVDEIYNLALKKINE